jgi:hypothetical protein
MRVMCELSGAILQKLHLLNVLRLASVQKIDRRRKP